MRKNGKTNAVGRGGALLRPAGYTELSKIFGESVCTYPLGHRGRCRSQPFATKERYGCGSAACRYTSARQNAPFLRESSANSQLPNGAMCASPPTSKEVTACGFAANSRRNSLHSAGRAEPRPYQLRLHFNGFCVKQTVYGLKLMTFPRRGSRWVLPRQCTAEQAKRPGFPFGKPGRSHFYPVTISPTPFRM